MLVLALCLSTFFLAQRTALLWLALPLLTLALLWLPLRLLRRGPVARATLTQLTGRCYFAFASSYLAVLWMPAP